MQRLTLKYKSRSMVDQNHVNPFHDTFTKYIFKELAFSTWFSSYLVLYKHTGFLHMRYQRNVQVHQIFASNNHALIQIYTMTLLRRLTKLSLYVNSCTTPLNKDMIGYRMFQTNTLNTGATDPRANELIHLNLIVDWPRFPSKLNYWIPHGIQSKQVERFTNSSKNPLGQKQKLLKKFV